MFMMFSHPKYFEDGAPNPYTASGVADAMRASSSSSKQSPPSPPEFDKFTTEQDKEEQAEAAGEADVPPPLAAEIKGPPFDADLLEQWGMGSGSGGSGGGGGGGLDSSAEEAEEDMDAWPEHVVTARIRFLTKETYPWEADDQQPKFRVDDYAFAAPYTDVDGVGNFRITDLS